jgi:hypothetical protein
MNLLRSIRRGRPGESRERTLGCQAAGTQAAVDEQQRDSRSLEQLAAGGVQLAFRQRGDDRRALLGQHAVGTRLLLRRVSWIEAAKMCAIQTAAIASESRPRKSWGRAAGTHGRGTAGTIAPAG